MSILFLLFGVGPALPDPGDWSAPAVLPPGGWAAVWYVTKRLFS